MADQTRTPGRRAPAARSRRPVPNGADARPNRWQRALLGGGSEGNERLTLLTGLLLLVLLAVLGITIVRIGQLLWLHLFLGLALLGPVALKLASTGYRFIRYYTSDESYRRKGPPAAALRALAPLVVLFTLIVFATGVALLLVGPNSGGRDLLVLVHKISFFAWLAVTAIHVLGHLPEVLRLLSTAGRSRREIAALRSSHQVRRSGPDRGASAAVPAGSVSGGRGRGGALGLSLVAGLIVAVALLGQFAPWTH
ncbi:MAG: hypothetical protein ACR2NR_01580 [Solirubrobacteraceae bacterium]